MEGLALVSHQGPPAGQSEILEFTRWAVTQRVGITRHFQSPALQ
jgi:hypothetical protein